MSAGFFVQFPHLASLLGNSLPRCELGPGQPKTALRSVLENLSDEQLFAGAAVRDRALAKCCRSGLWLLYDFLDESHTISQDVPTIDGSYWHGIMHRREPDYGNAKYWFRRVPRHPVYAVLAAEARELAAGRKLDAPAQFLASNTDWDPDNMIDLCEAIARGRSQCRELAEEVAMAEWRLLFQHCYAGAIGA